MQCPTCQTDNPLGRRTCYQCGALLNRMIPSIAPDAPGGPRTKKSAEDRESSVPPNEKPKKQPSRGRFFRSRSRNWTLAAAVGVLLATGGYYASAAGWTWNPNWGWESPRDQLTLSTETFAPGTPNWAIYPNSPYRVGGPLGPKPGQTWPQKFSPASTRPVSSASAQSTPASSASTVPASPVSDTQSASPPPAAQPASTTPPPSRTIPLPPGGYTVQTVGPVAGDVPIGWSGGVGQTVPPVGGAGWTNPQNPTEQLSITLMAPAFYGSVAARNLANPEWLLSTTTGGSNGWSYGQVVYWQSVGPNLWAYIEPAANHPGWWHYGLIAENVGSGFAWEQVDIRVPSQSDQWWGLLASWTHPQPTFIPPAQ